MRLDVSYSRRSWWLSAADRPLMPWRVCSRAKDCDGEGAFARFERLRRGPSERSISVRVAGPLLATDGRIADKTLTYRGF